MLTIIKFVLLIMKQMNDLVAQSSVVRVAAFPLQVHSRVRNSVTREQHRACPEIDGPMEAPGTGRDCGGDSGRYVEGKNRGVAIAEEDEEEGSES